MRFGVAGTAHWSRSVHVPALLATPGVELVGVYGRNPQHAGELAARHGLRAHGEFEALLDAVDAVSIAVPPEAQPGLALAALRRGKHVLLEKPLALTVAEADALREAAGGHCAALVFFMRRFVPEIEQALRLAAGRTWTQASARMHSSALSTDTPYRNSVWRQADAAVLWDIAPHILSLLLPVLGPVVEVTARLDAERTVHLHTVHAGGARAESSMTLRAPAGRTARAIVFGSGAERMTLPDPEFSFVQAFRAAATELVALSRAGNPAHRCDLDFAAAMTRVLAAAARSLADGTAVAPEPAPATQAA
jgi:predicted dehydrogenase